MRKLLLSSLAAFALVSSPVWAADMAAPVYKAPPPPPPSVSWTGCYLNVGYGYGMDNIDHVYETFPGLVPLNAQGTDGGRGWLGTVGGGCDLQLPIGGLGNFVVGAFADYDWMDIHGQVEDSVTVLQGDAKETGAWAAGGRFGYLVTPTLLTYFNGGYTQTRYNQVNLSAFGTAAPTFDLAAHTYNGWFIGGGTEYALNFSWLPIHGLFWRNEYRFSEYRAADLDRFVVATGAPTAFGDNYKPYVQTITSSLVWRFNWAGTSRY